MMTTRKLYYSLIIVFIVLAIIQYPWRDLLSTRILFLLVSTLLIIAIIIAVSHKKPKYWWHVIVWVVLLLFSILFLKAASYRESIEVPSYLKDDSLPRTLHDTSSTSK